MSYESREIYSKVFDHTQAPVWLGMLRYHYCASSTHSPPTGNSPVYLDLGCAEGHTILALAPLYPDIQFIGVDFNARHIENARSEAVRLNLNNAEFICADFRRLPDLPVAHYLVVRGIYSWLSPEVKEALELAVSRLAAPGSVLKLHYSVRPGALLREDLGQLLQCLPAPRTPAEGRSLFELVSSEGAPFLAGFARTPEVLKEMQAGEDALWWHDYLNEDFHATCAHEVIDTMAVRGLSYLCASDIRFNLPHILVTAKVIDFASRLAPSRAQTLFDHVTAAGSRDDVFVREPFQKSAKSFDIEGRYGLVQPEEKLTLPYQTVLGQIRYQHQDCARLLRCMQDEPRTWSELQEMLPDLSPAKLQNWLEMLLAGAKVGPFLPASRARAADRERLRRINRERLKSAMESFGTKTRTPLLAAEYGNCLVAGWFESLILLNFHKRNHPETQRQMVRKIHAARMGFRGADGKAASDQLAAFRKELEKLEHTYLCRMAYWGIEV